MLNIIRFLVSALSGLALAFSLSIFPISGQIPTLPSFPTPGQVSPEADSGVSRCIDLEGRCLFRVAGTQKEISDRASEIQNRLLEFSETYFAIETEQDAALEVEIEPVDMPSAITQPESEDSQTDFTPTEQDLRPRNIYLSLANTEQRVRLMSVTSQDANLVDQTIETRAKKIAESLKAGLTEAKDARQPEGFIRRIRNAIAIAFGSILLILASRLAIKSLQRSKQKLDRSSKEHMTTKLSEQQAWNLKEIQERLLQVAEFAIGAGGILLILDLFPATRPVASFIIYIAQIPVRFFVIGVITYIIIRVSFVLIDHFTSVLTTNYLLTPDANLRLQMRVSTISGVSKGILTVIWCIVGIFTALSWIEIDISPLLAGAGIIGLGLSFASQNLIKDALNGFFIILEDQYAVGDVISVGDVAGLVEDINLRITRLRDAEGRLVTIPNSEISIVANLSSNWSRANLAIPVGYHQDIDKALKLIAEVGEKMYADPHWHKLILEPPLTLGVDDFEHRGLLVRVWIKTQPMKQWDVSREFRRRIKNAFDEGGMPIPVAQQEIWFNQIPPKSESNGHSDTSDSPTLIG